ncbi:MAG: phytanoyl-CoA dioxygenase family protein [Sphingobium sp.]|uniref:phytanoyl-CoA dioxygenase family protein n=1 Tax=Sphingobium sp. TaxID=1912891 RepID=UPI0029A3A90D|nr:phytanoyl-CoA dioxygenase family protein [Sphingobium sp.]MDX3908847.1 phytanoyl-CoA dioxygenase family protein [Sphingobium sp.]
MKRSIRTFVAAPWYFLQLATGAKSFKDNPLIGSKRLNAWGLHEKRKSLAHTMAASRRRRLAHLLSAEDRIQFDAQGYVAIPDLLDPAEFETLRASLLERASPAREMLQGDTITRRIAIDARMLRDIPALAALLKMPRWRGLMQYVASYASEPLYYIQTILSHRADAPPDPQEALHADTFHPTMKAWFFLTDVAEDEGPFTYVPGSHKLTVARRAWEKARSLAAPEGVDHLSARGSMRVQEEELAQLGLPAPVGLAVKANTLVVADTSGFHARGRSARPTTRIEIWAYGRRNPFYPWTGLDPLSHSMIASSRVALMWKLRDRLSGWIGQPWNDVGAKRPADP